MVSLEVKEEKSEFFQRRYYQTITKGKNKEMQTDFFKEKKPENQKKASSPNSFPPL